MAVKLALAALAAVMTAAPSEPVKTGPGTQYYAGPPPVRYIKEGIYALMLVHPARLHEACGTQPKPGFTLYGCTRRTISGQPVIIMPLSAEPHNWFVLIHEAGHAAGWSGMHEQ